MYNLVMEFLEGKSLSRSQLSQLREIYEKSFPESERLDFQILLDTVHTQNRVLYIAKEKEDVLGFAIINRLQCSIACLLEYIAVKEGNRSQGIGTAFLDYLVRIISNWENAEGILLEVEPMEGAPPDEVAIRERRIKFYLRNGASIIDGAASYCMPNLSGSGILPMKLLWIPVGTTKSIISGEKLKECILSIYSDVYGRSHDSSLVMSILDGLER